MLNGLKQLAQTLQREKFALQRHKHRVGSGERVDGEQIQRRRAVDQHIGDRLVVDGHFGNVIQCRLQTKRPIPLGGDHQFHTQQVHGRGNDRNVGHIGKHRCVLDGRFVEQQVIGRALTLLAAEPKPGGGIALRIEIDDQNTLANRGEGSCKVNGRRRLADTTLLIGECNDTRMHLTSETVTASNT